MHAPTANLLNKDGQDNNVHLYFSFLLFSSQAVDQIVFQKRIQQQLQKSRRHPAVSINPSFSPELHIDVGTLIYLVVVDVACTLILFRSYRSSSQDWRLTLRIPTGLGAASCPVFHNCLMESPGNNHTNTQQLFDVIEVHVSFHHNRLFSVCCSSVSSFQESLLRMLLGIEMLQVRFF